MRVEVICAKVDEDEGAIQILICSKQNYDYDTNWKDMIISQ